MGGIALGGAPASQAYTPQLQMGADRWGEGEAHMRCIGSPGISQAHSPGRDRQQMALVVCRHLEFPHPGSQQTVDHAGPCSGALNDLGPGRGGQWIAPGGTAISQANRLGRSLAACSQRQPSLGLGDSSGPERTRCRHLHYGLRHFCQTDG